MGVSRCTAAKFVLFLFLNYQDWSIFDLWIKKEMFKVGSLFSIFPANQSLNLVFQFRGLKDMRIKLRIILNTKRLVVLSSVEWISKYLLNSPSHSHKLEINTHKIVSSIYNRISN